MNDSEPSSKQAFIIVGAGQAGAWVAKTLRTEGFNGRVILVGAERHLPYERPPLSKAILSGAADAQSACLLPEQMLGEIGIEHWAEAEVRNIDREAQTISLRDGRVERYDHLFLTTGARIRPLSMAFHCNIDKVHYLRTLDDAQRLQQAFAGTRKVAVVGGGWIGLEVAATARRMGLEVIVLEAAELPCMRSVPRAVSEFLIGLHRANGVEVKTGSVLTGVSTSQGGVTLTLADGTIEVDHVVVGIGVIPETRLAEDAGLAVTNGIVVDERGRTSDPLISAAGDVTSHPSEFCGQHVRLESWANAQNQAIVAAKAALGHDVRYVEIPWIWSDQYDANIQIIGVPDRAEHMLLRGDPSSGSGAWLAIDARGVAVGAVAVNAPKELRLVRKALEAGKTPDRSQWIDATAAVTRIELH